MDGVPSPSTARPVVRDAGRAVAPHSLRNNAAWMFGGQAVTWTLTAVTLALLPRYLGPADMGRIGIGMAFAQLTMTIAGLGIATLVTREVARRREAALEIVATAFWLSVVLGTLGSCITLGISMALGYETLTWVAIAVFAATVPFDLLMLFGFGVLQGFEVMRYHAIWDVANKLFLLTCLAVVVAFDLGLPVFLAASFLSSALPAVAIVRLMRRFAPFSPGTFFPDGALGHRRVRPDWRRQRCADRLPRHRCDLAFAAGG